MSDIQEKLNAIVAADPDTAAYGATVGAGVGGQTGNNGRIYIALKPWDERVGGSAQQYIGRLRPKVAAVAGGAAFLQAAQDIRVGGRLSKTEFQYTLQDANLAELYSWSPKILAKLQGLPILRDVTTDQQMSGTAVPLSTFVKLDTKPVQPLSINHQSQFPSVTISFNLAPGAALSQAVVAINQAVAEIGAPSAIQGSFQGTAAAFQSSLSSQPYLIAAALITVYIILGILYESYILPLTILSTLPSAGVGAFLILMIAHYDLSMVAMIGVILLIGIVKKNGIMMVDFAISAERRDGMKPHDAIRQACLLRFRPILMTTMAALLTGLPLMLGNGAGSELRKPLGYAMVGGLILSQILTLYTTPVIYLYLDKLQHLMSRKRSRMPALASKMGASSGD
jgi:multidrug efflux pump subunit AcrB